MFLRALFHQLSKPLEFHSRGACVRASTIPSCPGFKVLGQVEAEESDPGPLILTRVRTSTSAFTRSRWNVLRLKRTPSTQGNEPRKDDSQPILQLENLPELYGSGSQFWLQESFAQVSRVNLVLKKSNPYSNPYSTPD